MLQMLSIELFLFFYFLIFSPIFILVLFAYKKMYNFTTFAMQLNELDKEIETVIPKTDSRLRPDIRAMENGDIGMCVSLYIFVPLQMMGL